MILLRLAGRKANTREAGRASKLTAHDDDVLRIHPSSQGKCPQLGFNFIAVRKARRGSPPTSRTASARPKQQHEAEQRQKTRSSVDVMARPPHKRRRSVFCSSGGAAFDARAGALRVLIARNRVPGTLGYFKRPHTQYRDVERRLKRE